MSGLPSGDRGTSLGIEEVDVDLRIEEGKMTAESHSGPKSGSVHLDTDGEGEGADLVLSGAGRDRGSATLSRPELSSFRAALDGALSDVADDASAPGVAGESVYSGEATLQRIDGGVGVAIDEEAIRDLDLAPGGERRRVECTITEDGRAIIDLTGGDEP